jgi:hypothetical protein
MLDAAFPRGALNYWKAQYLTELSDAAIRTLVECFDACPSPMSMMVVEHVHGAVTRVPVEATACPVRVEGFNVVIISQWTDPRATDAGIAWARNTYAALQPYLASTRYVNYLAADEGGTDPAAEVYGPNYAPLRPIKAKYDPENIFHANVNIRPA